MAKNDWIVAGLNNPDFSNEDFSNIADMTVDNTQLLSKDEYLKSDFIKNNDMFKDANGQFSEQKFTDYYQKRVQDFGSFQQGEYSQGPALDMFDIDRKPDSKIQEINFNISRGINPDRQAIGIEGVNVYSDPEFSRREIAKQNKVFDTATGKFTDYTVNEHTLVSNPIEWVKDQFRDPLVLATWDEDGEHLDPMTGTMKKHQKGDAKLNDKGTYYYETLGGRSVIGKDVLSVFDTFTVDGQGINKYDFFDSNDIEKSVSGTVAKNVAALIPLFCGPVVGGIYALALTAKEFSKSLPMLYGMATALSDSETPSWINSLAARGTKYTGSTSDYAQQKTFAFENFGNLVSDVALQWGQQKFIAQAVTKMKGTPDYIADARKNAKALYDAKRATLGDSAELMQVCLNRYMPKAQELATKSGQLGRDLSLAYMAIISNSDVYSSALEHGTTKKEAAAIALGSTLGMFAVDKYAHLGEIFFDEATPEASKLARQALRNEVKSAQSAFNQIRTADIPARNKLLQYIQKGAEMGKRVFNKFGEDLKYHTLGMTGKMVGEGLEEVSEELVADVSKHLYELAGDFGFDTSVRDVGAWDNAFDRYAMSFLGGAVGGGVFYGKEVFDGKKFHRPKLDEDIATLIRNGHVDELRTQLANMRKEGRTGSKALSATEYELGTDGKPVWRTTDNEDNSQAQAIADLVMDRINSIEEVLLANRVGLSDDQLFENMVLSEKRYNRYKSIAQLTNYYQDYANVLDRLVKDELALKAAGNTIEGKPNGTAIPNDTALSSLTPQQQADRQANIDALTQKVEGSRKAVRDFLSGNTSLDYTRKLNFAMDPALHTAFLDINQQEFFESKHPGKTIDQLTLEEQMKFLMKEWPEYVQTQLKTKLSTAWDKFKQLEQVVNPHLDTMEQQTPTYKAWLQNLEDLFTNGDLNPETLVQSYKTYNDKLDTETDDEYNNRSTKLVDPVTGATESDADFLNRRLNRRRQIDAFNEQQEKAWADKIDAELQKVNYSVDPMMLRSIKQILPQSGRLRQVLLRKLHLTALSPELRTIIAGLNTDLSNIDEVKANVRSAIETQTVKPLDQLISDVFVDGMVEDVTGGQISFAEFFEQNIADPDITLQDVLDDPDILSELTDESQQKIIDAIETLANSGVVSIDDVSLEGMVNQESVRQQNGFNDAIDRMFNPIENTINSVVADYNNNPLVQLQNKLTSSLENPITTLLTGIAASNNDTIDDVESILTTIQDKYDNLDDASELILDDTQRANLEKAKNYMELLKVYMTAASTIPTTTAPIGHNRTANVFAQTHADKLRSPWQKLPEIDADYATLYTRTLHSYASEIDAWIKMSDDNQVNKIRKFVEADRKFSNTMWSVLSSITRDFDFNGKHYDLLQGINDIDITNLNTDLAQIPLYNLERLIYKNVNDIAQEHGVTVPDLIKNSNLLETMIQGLKALDNKRSSPIGASLSPANFTDFDKLQYIAMMLSTDPAVFYKQLRQRVTTNRNIAPLTVQEIDTRIAQASMTQTFRDIIAHAYSKLDNQETPLLTNTTLLFGVAGAGKTQVILNSIDSSIKDKPVIIAGPTDSQALAMQRAMGRNKSMSFNQLLESILGTQQLKEIREEFAKSGKSPFKGKFFDINEGQDGLNKVKLHENQITFQALPEVPAAIYLDEATHLNTLEALIVDTFARQVGAQVFMCGDTIQRGYSNPTNGVQNIDEGAVWAAKAPKLSISLRDNNLQKFQNQEAVRTLLEELMDKRLNASVADYEAFFPTALSLAKKFNFKIYNQDELNGDMITQQLDDAVIAKLKAAATAGKSIAFIGDETSAHLAKLRNEGVNIEPKQVFNLDKMQGQEFDLVVIDYTPKNLAGINDTKTFLQDLYTLMTRAREASIFIDNGLSQIIGKSVVSPNKSKAPSILSGVEELRNKKLDILDQLDLNPLQNPTQQGQGQQGQGQQGQSGQGNPNPNQGQQNPEMDFDDPLTRTNQSDPDIEAIVGSLADEDGGTTDNGNAEINVDGVDVGNFLVECYGDATYLGLVEGPKQRVQTADGKTVEMESWEVRMPSDPNAELRNLQAIAPGETAVKYKDKIALQKKLYQTKSAILFDYVWPTRVNPKSLPSFIVNNFNQSDWENGTFELEFRKVDASDTQPIWGRFRRLGPPGFEYGGTRLIANVVFKVKNKQGQTCKFDLAGINDPKTLLNNSSKIKDSLRAKIADPKTVDSTRQKLQGLLNTWDTDVQHYSNWFNDRMDDFIQNGYYSLDITSAVRRNKTTIFRKRAKNNPIRLGGDINPDNIDIDSDIHNLVEMNPDKVFSPVYTFTGNEKDFLNLDQSLAGKAVVFVSSDTLADPKELINKYIQQKTHPDGNTPEVRMIVLQPYGVTFHQLLDEKFASRFQNGDIDKVPFRKNFMGIRMFTSMWNARASLIQFTKALTDWKTANNFSDAQVRTLTLAQYMKFKGEPDAKIDQVLQSAGLTADSLALLEEFNNVTLKDVPTYRLGYSENGNGFHIQSTDVKDSTAYDTDSANLLYITPEKSEQFLNMLSSIIRHICPDAGASGTVISQSLNLQLEKTNPDGTRTPWAADELIDLSQANHRRSLSGLLSKPKDAGNIVITDPDTGRELAFLQGEYWSLIPRLLSNVVRTINYYQRNDPNGAAAQNALCAHISFIGDDANKTTTKLDLSIAEFFGPQGFLNTSGSTIDNSLYHMFDLIFHGSIEDIHAANKPIQLTDAYFKHGFDVHPDITRSKNGAGALDISGFLGTNGEMTFYEIGTPEYFFTADVDVLSAGLQISLKDMMALDPYGPIPPVPPNQTETVQADDDSGVPPVEPTIPVQHQQIIDFLQKIGVLDDEFVYDDDSMDEAIDKFNERKHSFFWNKMTTNPSEAITQIYEYKDGKFITYIDWLKTKYGDVQVAVNQVTQRLEFDYNGSTYAVDPALKDVVKTASTAPQAPASEQTQGTVPTRFTESYNSTTVGDAMMDILNNRNSEIIDKILEFDDTVTSEEAQQMLDSFARAMEQIIGNSQSDTATEDSITSALSTLDENADDVVKAAISDIDENLWNKIFNDC